MQATATKAGITLKLTVEEALHLAALLGQMTPNESAGLPYYDDLADALEARTKKENPNEDYLWPIFDTVSDQLRTTGIGTKVEAQMQEYSERRHRYSVAS